MADFPAMPLWTDAYLADTRHLSDAEHGRYLLMLMDMWRMPEKRFPNDDAWLARKFSRSIEDVKTLFRPLIAEFFQSDGNWICQKRLAREWHKLRGTSARQSAAAKARWAKEKNASHGNAALAMQPQPQPQPHKKEESHRRNGSTVHQFEAEFSDTFWPAYPCKKAKPAALTAFAKQRRTYSLETIMTGLARYKREKPPDRAWLHPTTFLNQERFNDEPEPRAGRIDVRAQRQGHSLEDLMSYTGEDYPQ